MMQHDIFPLFEIVILLLLAKLGAFAFAKMKFPPVLGELTVGIIIGNLWFLTGGYIEIFKTLENDTFIQTIAELGVIILLFEVGLQSNIGEMLKVGWPSLRVAIVGVVLPILLGYFFSFHFGIAESTISSLFLGAILSATSVGITARVLKDTNKLDLKESQVILGAAVIDDILALIIMAILIGMVQTGTVVVSGAIQILGGALLFIFGSILVGKSVAKYFMNLARFFEVKGVKLTLALGVCISLAILADKIGLAPIIGAFAAGLILDDVHFDGFNEQRSLEEIITPISQFFVPIFFVVIGAQVNLLLLAEPTVLIFGLVLTLLAIIGKYFAGFAAYPEKLNYHAIGFGMIPRGEVGLIFAAEGIRLKVISETLFAITVLIVMLTTLVTPILLTRSLKKD